MLLHLQYIIPLLNVFALRGCYLLTSNDDLNSNIVSWLIESEIRSRFFVSLTPIAYSWIDFVSVGILWCFNVSTIVEDVSRVHTKAPCSKIDFEKWQGALHPQLKLVWRNQIKPFFSRRAYLLKMGFEKTVPQNGATLHICLRFFNFVL